MSGTTSSSFHFAKWYADVLDDQGHGLIVYTAAVHWNAIRLGYRGMEPLEMPGLVRENAWSIGEAPIIPDGDFQWKSTTIDLRWSPIASPVEETLLEEPDGFLKWSCLQPASRVSGSASAKAYNGLGYVEKIEMTLFPWNLPIRHLYWGRYVSEKFSIVWIRWEGPAPRLSIFFNGTRLSGTVTDLEITFEGYRLTLPRLLIRKGNLMDSVFSRFEKIAKWFPSSILSLYEERWYGPAALVRDGQVTDQGSVIHEKVKWP